MYVSELAILLYKDLCEASGEPYFEYNIGIGNNPYKFYLTDHIPKGLINWKITGVDEHGNNLYSVK